VAVRGYTRMVLEGRGGPVSAAQQEFLNIVADNASRLVKAINYAAQLNPDELCLEVCDLLALWRCAVERIGPAAAARGIRIFEQAPEGCYEVIVDGARVAQVLDALLENSVKFTGNNGEITGEFKLDEGTLILRISDTGAGIPQGLMEKMFDRYPPEAGANSEAADVRLPLVYDIIRLHGGRLSVASNAGEGCTFVVELPAIQAHHTQEDQASEQASRSSSGR